MQQKVQRRPALPAFLASTFLLVLFPGAAEAQLSRIEGAVVDDTGAPLEGAEIHLRHADTNALLKTTKTSKKGRYLYMVESGTYFIWPTLEGYMAVRQVADITSQAGDRGEFTNFYDDKQEFEEPKKRIHFLPSAVGDVTSKARNKIDFVMAPAAKYTETLNRLYAEYRGAKAEAPPAGGAPAGGAGTPPAPAPAAAAEKDPLDAAVELLAQKDYAGAIPLLKKKLEAEPDNAEAYYQIGKAALELEGMPEAEASLKKAKELDPTKPGVSFHLARYYDKKGRKVQAIQALEEERAMSPDSHAVLDSLAGLYAETGQNDKAVEVYESLIAVNPEELDAYVALASLYKESGDRAKEEETYRRLGDRDPTGTSLYNLGNLAFNRNESEKASVYYKQVLQKDPSHAMAHLQLGYTLVSLGDFPGAVSHFETYLKLKPKDVKAAEARRMIDELRKIAPQAGKGGR